MTLTRFVVAAAPKIVSAGDAAFATETIDRARELLTPPVISVDAIKKNWDSFAAQKHAIG